eukprot:1161698-Pelagomonas_calceolata.AAC.8
MWSVHLEPENPAGSNAADCLDKHKSRELSLRDFCSVTGAGSFAAGYSDRVKAGSCKHFNRQVGLQGLPQYTGYKAPQA